MCGNCQEERAALRARRPAREQLLPLSRAGTGWSGGGDGVEGGSFYSAVSDERDLGLQVAAALRGVDDEIAVLRMLIRKVAREGDVETTRRAIDTLCRALKVQYALDGRPAEGLASSIARVLDELGNEMGMSL